MEIAAEPAAEKNVSPKLFVPTGLYGRFINATYSQRHFDRNKNPASDKTGVKTIYITCFPADLAKELIVKVAYHELVEYCFSWISFYVFSIDPSWMYWVDFWVGRQR